MSYQEEYPSIGTLVTAVLRVWPKHKRYIDKTFKGRSHQVMSDCDQLSAAIIRMAETVPGGLIQISEDYKYFSENVIMQEQFYFQINGEYSTKTFAEANEKYYSNSVFMRQYANCLALSTVLWENHANVFSAFMNDYLPGLGPDCRLMEIGPAHGFALYFAAVRPNVVSLTGWDVSPTAIDHTRQVLDTLGIQKTVNLKVQDLFKSGSPPADGGFDAIVIGEVIEHLEDPRLALRSVAQWLNPGGRMWLTTPVNSPFPDHIYLFRKIEEVHELVRECGFEIIQHKEFPVSGMTIEEAIKLKQPISCIMTVMKSN
jgi:2-polyprenyl-3-methyl-5-hydroxy-6-metoxy-1,4-benzoquinol methylase